MQTLLLELPDALNARLLAFANQRGVSAEQVVLEALQKYLTRQAPLPASDSFAERAAWILDIPTATGGPTDLSTNKDHMKGYGRD